MARIAELVSSKLSLLTDSYNAQAKTLITPVYNVVGYGAKGDGVADDTAAIQSAIDAAIAAGAKIVYFPRGTYKVTSLTGLSSVVLVGDNASFSGIPNQINQLGSTATGSDFGVMTRDYVISGGVATKDGVANNKLNVTEIKAVVGNLYKVVAATSFTTSVISAIYYLDLKSDGTYNFDTSHATGTYVVIAEVVTDASGNISTVTDKRGLVGGFQGNANGILNVMTYGAKGDGVTDDTAAIQAAIDACPNYGIVAFPPGVYRVTQTFTFNRPVSLVGYGGKHGCTIYADFAVADQAVFEYIGTADATIRYCRIEHLTVRAKNVGYGRGFTLQYANRFVFNDVQLYELYRGIYTYYAHTVSFRDVIAYNISQESVKLGSQSNHLTFDHCRFVGNIGLQVVGGLASLTIQGCAFEQAVSHGISLEPPTGQYVEGVVITGSYWEQIGGAAVNCAGAGENRGVVIDGNYFYGGFVNKFASAAGKATYGIILTNTKSFRISENRFYDWQTAAIYRNDTELNGTVENNSLESCPAITSTSNAANKSVKIRNNTYGRQELYTTAAPTTGTWSLGDVAYNTSPAAAGKIGWVCVTAGTPGTWKAFGAIDA